MHAANALKYAACLGVVATSACVDLARVAVETGRGPARFAGVDAETWKHAWLVVACGKTVLLLVGLRGGLGVASHPSERRDGALAGLDGRRARRVGRQTRVWIGKRNVARAVAPSSALVSPRWGYHLAMARSISSESGCRGVSPSPRTGARAGARCRSDSSNSRGAECGRRFASSARRCESPRVKMNRRDEPRARRRRRRRTRRGGRARRGAADPDETVA